MIYSRNGKKVYSARSKDLMLAVAQIVAEEVSHTQLSRNDDKSTKCF